MFLTAFRRSSRARGKSQRNPALHRRLAVEPLEQRTLLSGGTFVQQAMLHASKGAVYAGFGDTVSISGNTMVVGSPFATVGKNSEQGAVYVFTHIGSAWTQTAKLTASNGAAYADFGDSVSISGDMLVVGAPSATASTDVLPEGEAYVFTFTKLAKKGYAWEQTAELTASDGAAGDQFGSSVSISGNTAAVGALNATVGENTGQGEAYVFSKPGSRWSQTAELIASDGAENDNFGSSVSISGDTVVVGAPYATVYGNEGQGKAYVFVEPGSGWADMRQDAELAASAGTAFSAFRQCGFDQRQRGGGRGVPCHGRRQIRRGGSLPIR